jgi:hypothetical protein
VSWTKIAAGMSEREEDAASATMTLCSWFSFERSLSDILAGPMSSVLLGDEVGLGLYGLGKWKGVVVFSGVVLLLSSTEGLVWFWERGRGRRIRT